MKKHGIVAALLAIAVGLAAIIPIVAHAVFAALGWIFTMVGAGFTFIAAWFAKSSDEPHEKAIWGAILLFITRGMILYFGLPLIKYWPILLIILIIFVIAVLNAKRKLGRRK